MKTLLLLTNLTISDEPLAELALNIAVKAEANLLLSHTILNEKNNEEDVFVEDQILKEKKLQTLEILSSKLSQSLESIAISDYIPKINYHCCFAEQVDIGQLITDELWMVMMGLGSNRDLLNNFVYGTPASHIINQVFVPVLLVNKNRGLESLRKIALSTDFDINEVEAIKFLVKFSTFFDSQIILVHDVKENVIDIRESTITVKAPKLKFPKLFYHMIEGGVFDKELHILSSDEYFDTIGFVCKTGDLFRQMFYSPAARILIQRPESSVFVFHHD